MNKNITSSKKKLYLLTGFMAVFLLVLNATTLVLYRRAKQHLDNELGARLNAVATGLAHAVELATPDSLAAGNVGAGLYTLLHVAAGENNLSNIVILTPDGLTVADLAGFALPGETNPFIDLDFSAVTLARAGIPAYTSLYKSGDVYMKSAYAPVLSGEDEVIGIVGVEAGAGFFKDLRELSRVIAFILVASFLAVAGLGWLFYRQSLALDRAQEAVYRRENLATVGRMVANIAHDIRNPLSVINTSAERLRKKYKLDDEIFSFISEEVDELNRILTGYLEFAGSHSGDTGPHSAQKIIDRCLVVLEPEFEAKHINLERDVPEAECTIRGNDKRLQQAVMNVLLNSLQAVETGGCIEITLDHRPPFGVILVKDDGRGIEEREIKEVTKPFFTNRADGSGLGLSIVKTIIEEHDGRLDITSKPGSGTTVGLYIPLAR